MSRRIMFSVLAAAAVLTIAPAGAAQRHPGHKSQHFGYHRAHHGHAGRPYRLADRLARVPAAIVAVPGMIYPDGNVEPAYRYVSPDPWKLCQPEPVWHRTRFYDCGPYNYYPFGLYGYRPNGTYRAYRSPPVHVLGPAAKIISIEPRE